MVVAVAGLLLSSCTATSTATSSVVPASAQPVVGPSATVSSIDLRTSYLASGGGYVWALGAGAGVQLQQISPATDQPLGAPIRLPIQHAVAFTYGARSAWVLADNMQNATWSAPADLYRIDPSTGKITAKIKVGTHALGLAYAFGHIWTANASSVSEVSPKTNTVVRWIKLSHCPSGVTGGAGSLWVTTECTNETLVRIDPRSGAIKARMLGVGLPVFGLGSAWIPAFESPGWGIARLDLSSDKIVPGSYKFVSNSVPSVVDGELWAGEALKPPSSSPSPGPPEGGVTMVGIYRYLQLNPKTMGTIGQPVTFCGGGYPLSAFGSLWCRGPLSVQRMTPTSALPGTVSGHLFAVGGAATGSPRPLSGSVTMAGDGKSVTVSVGTDGRFSTILPAGLYQLTGTSPLYQGGKTTCNASSPVMVQSGTVVQAPVYCQEK